MIQGMGRKQDGTRDRLRNGDEEQKAVAAERFEVK